MRQCSPHRYYGQLGHNNRRDRMEPQQVGAEWMCGAKIVTTACDEAHTAAVTEEGGRSSSGRRNRNSFLERSQVKCVHINRLLQLE